MSASLIVLIPLVSLGLVAALCFVGCTTILGDYEEAKYPAKIAAEPNLIAWWRLSDTTLAAVDDGPNHFKGDYTGAGGSFTLQEASLLPSDPVEFSVLFDGGFVNVQPFHQELHPDKFTLEAWVKPAWKDGDAQATRAVLASASVAAGAGYALFATDDNYWEVNIGGPGQTLFVFKAPDPIDLTAVNYLAVTFDGTDLTLFVGTHSDAGSSFKTYPPVKPGSFVPENGKTGTPLFIGRGRADMTGGDFPFNGFIQHMAIYKDGLSGPTILDHFNTGLGT